MQKLSGEHIPEQSANLIVLCQISNRSLSLKLLPFRLLRVVEFNMGHFRSDT